MKIKRLFIKEKLLIAIFVFFLVYCDLNGGKQFAVKRSNTDINTTKTIFDQNEMYEDIECCDTNELLVDIEMEDGTLGWCPIIYEKEQAEQEERAKIDVEAGILLKSRSGPHGELRVLHSATQIANVIIIKIIADRYTETQQEMFFSAAQNMANNIVNSHPMKEYKEWIQIYAIGTISPSSNLSIIVGGGSAGTGSGDITRANTRPFVQHHFPSVQNPSIENNYSWLVMQNGRNGGYAYPDGYNDEGVAVTSITERVGSHEIGHLWGLWDEYDSSTTIQYIEMVQIQEVT